MKMKAYGELLRILKDSCGLRCKGDEYMITYIDKVTELVA
jgi:hypothetical protein